MSNITFSTCLYNLKNRHSSDKHIEWMRGFIRIVNRFNLVIYTDEESSKVIKKEIEKIDSKKTKELIKVIIKPFTEFYNYKHAEYWIKNNDNPECKLYDVADWRLNMLWCEKVHFVNETIEHKYFDTEYYGWCDIGYFRDTLLPRFTMLDAHTEYSKMIHDNWPNPSKIDALDKTRVYYGCNIHPESMHIASKYYSDHFHPSNLDNETGLRIIKYHKAAHYISGGFFITGREKMKWWVHTFQTTLEKYIRNNEVIQDDQQLIADCIFTKTRHRDYDDRDDRDDDDDFCIMKVNEYTPDKLWFMFRYLLL